MDAMLAVNEIIDNAKNQTGNKIFFDRINLNKKAKKHKVNKLLTSYTFVLQKHQSIKSQITTIPNTDNLVVELNQNGNYVTHILRYTPTAQWFSDQNSTVGNYSGNVDMLDQQGQSIASLTLINGQPQTTTNVSAKSESCELILESILCVGTLDGGFETVEEDEDCTYTYELNCTGGSDDNSGGNDDGNGNDYNDGSDNTGGGGTPRSGSDNINTNPSVENCRETNSCEIDSIVVEGPDNPIVDILDFLECFDTTEDASFTIYALEPNPGSGESNAGSAVGHAFISIVQGTNMSTYGFYPVSDWINPCINSSGTSVLGNDGGQVFTASHTVNISSSQLQQILDLSSSVNNVYDLDTYNCTDFAIDAANLAGLGFSACNGSWTCGAGSNPGALGMEIRNKNATNGEPTNVGTAPNSQKGC
ncbi:hypothetical protein [Winogradskyella sp.]|uniref:hypothetical protein n=1 Tax=Winogradskyella sp. TaxID=1883156 RepID=UPI003862F968